MRAATGNALLINIIITFLVIVLAVLVASITYTKAFRVKNRIVDIIESYEGDFSNKKSAIINEIDTSLNSVGYKISTNNKCKDVANATIVTTTGSNYDYCIYEYKSKKTNESYYGVVSYMYLDIPVVGSYLKLPVKGQTKVFRK